MKQLVFFVLAITLAGQSFAQKIDKVKIDPISGDTTITTTSEKIYSKNNWKTMLTEIVNTEVIKSKHVYYLEFAIHSDNSSAYRVKDGDSAILKLDDNSLVTLKPALNSLSTFPGSYSGDGAAFNVCYYILDGDSMHKLRAHKVIFIRLQTSGANKDFEIKDNKGEVIKNLLGVMSSKEAV